MIFGVLNPEKFDIDIACTLAHLSCIL